MIEELKIRRKIKKKKRRIIRSVMSEFSLTYIFLHVYCSTNEKNKTSQSAMTTNQMMINYDKTSNTLIIYS